MVNINELKRFLENSIKWNIVDKIDNKYLMAEISFYDTYYPVVQFIYNQGDYCIHYCHIIIFCSPITLYYPQKSLYIFNDSNYTKLSTTHLSAKQLINILELF